MITSEDALIILQNTIKNDLRHKDYARVTDLFNTYKMYSTGKGIENVLKQFNPREDKVMFDQRVALTVPVTPATLSSLRKPFNKVPRTPPITNKITALKDQYKSAVAEIEDRINKFYGSDNNIGGLDYYMQNRYVDLQWLDPNAWIMVEFDEFNPMTEKATPRPYEVSAKEAINFSIINNIAQWLIVEAAITYKEGDQDKPGKKYTMYAPVFAITLTQVAEGTISEKEIVEIEKKGFFEYDYFEHKSPIVQGFRVGYIYDNETGGRTFVSPYHEALCFLKKSIKQGSEFDFSTILHLFPQKVIRITKSCPGEKNMSCDRGRLSNGNVCGTCNGTGKPIHTSGQDVIEVALPETKEDYVSLSDFVHYVQLPIELLRLQKEWVDSLKIDVHQTVFNSSVLLRKGTGFTGGDAIAVTATEKDQDMEGVYDALAPFGEKVASVRTSIVELIAIFTDNKDKVSIIYRLPTKFKLKSRIDLYNERAALNSSGAPSFAIDSIDDELAQDIYMDDADGMLRYSVMKDHHPFNGKSTSEILILLNSPNVLQATKILYSYFDEIFTDIEKEDQNFYLLNFRDRKLKLDEKVSIIAEALNKENKPAFNFNMNE